MIRIASYKALYRLFGGFVADVVAAIDQVWYKYLKVNKLPVAGWVSVCEWFGFKSHKLILSKKWNAWMSVCEWFGFKSRKLILSKKWKIFFVLFVDLSNELLYGSFLLPSNLVTSHFKETSSCMFLIWLSREETVDNFLLDTPILAVYGIKH